MNTSPYTVILPDDPRHRKVIAAAIKASDQVALSALKGRTGRPIHFVTNWFAYYLMRAGHTQADVVTIWSPKTRLDYAKFENVPLEPDAQRQAVPLTTYEFLT